MSSIVVAGDTSGSVTLQAPAVSGTTVITLPATSGTMALSGGAGSFTTLDASGVATFSAGSASAPAITTTGDTNAGVFFPAADTVAIATSGSERMRIDSSGNVMVGTTSLFSGGEKLLVTTSGTDWTGIFKATNATAGSNYGVLVDYTQAPNGTLNSFFRGSVSNGVTVRFEARSNGGVANYSANNVNLSDRREKSNFAPAGNYLDKICAIPVQTFNYIDQDFEEDDGLTLGVVAQDVQAVCPEMVMESNWGSKEDPKMRLSIYQTDLQYALMKCIQEQQALIENLTTRLSALENK